MLHSDREAIGDVPAVYFVLPTQENIQRICKVCISIVQKKENVLLSVPSNNLVIRISAIHIFLHEFFSLGWNTQ